MKPKVLCLVATSLPAAREAGPDVPPLPAPVIVATITTDKRFIGGFTPSKVLGRLADKLGLLTYTIVDADAADLPGHQFELFTSVAQSR